MNYAIDWTALARGQLAAIWVQQVPLRQAITAAQARIDQLLAAAPLQYGRHVSEGLFAIEVHPLRAQFEISDDDQLFTVVSVALLP